jgi:branched-chain amino acid transport system permease protein
MSKALDVDSVLTARRDYNTQLARVVGSRKRAGGTVLAILAVLAAFPLVQLSGINFNYPLHMLLLVFMYVTMASSWNILGGYAGYISLGHNVFFGIGGYFSGMIFVFWGISPFLTAPLAGLVASLIGFGVGLITLRVRGPSFIISTIALLMIFRILFDNWQFVGGTGGVTLPLIDLPVEWVKVPYYYAFLAIAVLTVVVSYKIKHSKFGLGLRAISQDEVKAESAGIDTRMYKVVAFAISAFFVGMVGAIWGDYLNYIRPNIFLIILVAANIVLMAILGGKGTVAGPIVGTILLIAFNEAVVAYFGATQLNILGTGVLMLLVLLYFPNGVVGSLARAGNLPRFLDWD